MEPQLKTGTLGFITRALRYNWDQYRANPANLIAGSVGMVINNVIFLSGIWMMLFAGKTEHQSMQTYYFALNALIMVSWGFVTFFMGGLRDLAFFIEDGTLEPMMATPRPTLLLIAFSRNQLQSFGDLVMGSLILVVLAIHGEPAIALRAIGAISISCFAWVGFLTAVGSVGFFVSRGSSISEFLIMTTISLSSYPTGTMFTGLGRILMLSLPVGAISILPVEAIMGAGWKSYAVSFAIAVVLAIAGYRIFTNGLKRYQAVSLIGARA